MIHTIDDRTYLAHDLPVCACHWCQIFHVLRDPLDGEVFLSEGQVLLVSPDRTAITPHWKGCKSS